MNEYCTRKKDSMKQVMMRESIAHRLHLPQSNAHNLVIANDRETHTFCCSRSFLAVQAYFPFNRLSLSIMDFIKDLSIDSIRNLAEDA